MYYHRGVNIYLVSLLGIVTLLSACDEFPSHKKKPPAAPTYMLYSPNGEPLNGGPLGKPTCEKALSGWFDRMSPGNTNITKEAFLNDAQTQFNRMDIDKKGYLVSEELDRFRQPYRQESAAFKPDPDEQKSQKGQHKAKHTDNSSGKDGSSSGNLIDPVMSADTNLDFQVTQSEFMTQAQENFSRLDVNHDSMLSREEIVATCHTEDKP